MGLGLHKQKQKYKSDKWKKNTLNKWVEKQQMQILAPHGTIKKLISNHV